MPPLCVLLRRCIEATVAGTEADYLASLKGKDGLDGESAPLDGLMTSLELRQAGKDMGVPYMTAYSLVYHLDGDLKEARGGSALATTGTAAFNATGAIPPNGHNTLEGSATGAFTTTILLGSTSQYCTDFYIKVTDAPADCVLLEVESWQDKVRLLRRGAESALYDTSEGDLYDTSEGALYEAAGATEWLWQHERGDRVIEEVPFTGDLSDWLHIAVSFRSDAVYAWWGSDGLASWERYHTAGAVASVVIGGGATIALDEVMADATVAMTETQFRERTTTPMAWAARRNERALTLMAADPSKVETNLDKAPAIQAAIQTAMQMGRDEARPVGSTYIQFPFMKSPTEIMAWATWQDVTSKYGGAFFRALGSNSAEWGTQQAEGLPNIKGTFSGVGQSFAGEGATLTGAFYIANTANAPAEGVAQPNSGANDDYFGFDASRCSPIYGANTHVTPVNYAIRIWKRIK